jgi:hypothetical protein
MKVLWQSGIDRMVLYAGVLHDLQWRLRKAPKGYLRFLCFWDLLAKMRS